MSEIVPTVVPTTYEDVVSMRERYGSFLSSLHIDVADGVFAPNQTWFPKTGEILPDSDSIFYGAHLMVQEPEAVGLSFRETGCRGLEAHTEVFDSYEHGLKTVTVWREAGVEKIGIALLFQTPLEVAEPYFASVDYVRLMTIQTIGIQGIPFEEKSISRVQAFHARYPDIPIAVDGGVSEKNIQALAKAGASLFAVGSAIAKAENPAATYQQLLSLTNTL